MLFVTIVLALITIGLWLPNLVDLTARLARVLRPRAPAREALPAARTPRLLFLVPAHNEEILITQCVQSLVAMDYPVDARRIVVVADNSNDDTARLARAAGAECLERFDTERRGKPRALAWALEQVSITDFDACVIVDADTAVDRAFARGLAMLAPLDGIAVQGYFGMMNEWDNWLTRLAGVLMRCRYEVTYILRDRAGLNCPLTGNGMCIGRRLLDPGGWPAFSLTENWELYARYAAEGVTVRYAANAHLYSQEARSMEQGQTQRSRWLAGRTWVLRTWGMSILKSRRATLAEKFVTVAELAGLSPVLHLMGVVVVTALSLLLPAPTRWWMAGLALGSLASQGLTTLLVLARHPEPRATLAAFARLPVYAVWRAAVALGTFVLPGTGEWRKTERHRA